MVDETYESARGCLAGITDDTSSEALIREMRDMEAPTYNELTNETLELERKWQYCKNSNQMVFDRWCAEQNKVTNLTAEIERLTKQRDALRRLVSIVQPFLPVLSEIVAMRDDLAQAWGDADKVMRNE